GMIAQQDGTFRTADLEPGTYTFLVSAAGYRDGQCTATIPFGAPAAGVPYGAPGQPGGYPPADGAMPGQYGAPGQPPGQPAPYGAIPPAAPGAPPAAPGQPGAQAGMPSATVTCELEPTPKVGNVNGQLRDAETSAAVGGSAVKITDKLGRS